MNDSSQGDAGAVGVLIVGRISIYHEFMT